MSESDDFRTFIREVTLRFERGIERISRDIRLEVAEHRTESRRYFEVLDRKLDESERRTGEIIAENRARREALFRILDRLDGNGGPAAA